MRIALVASEATPLSKTGGLADVAGALFKEFSRMGVGTDLFVPLYRETRERFGTVMKDSGVLFDVPVGGIGKVCRVYSIDGRTLWGRETQDPGGTVYLLGNDEFFDRDDLYDSGGMPYPDNDQRFVFFSRAVIECLGRLGLTPDIIHCNDWQTALVPLYAATVYRQDPAVRRARTVFTIHNLAYQGVFPPSSMATIGLGWEHFTPEGIEYYGRVSFLKAGIIWADRITTVSTTYAAEILTPELGFGLDGLLRKRRAALCGILNGIDYDEWDPASDSRIPKAYDVENLSGKHICKRAVISNTGLKGPADAPLACFVGRLTEQKGVGLLMESIPELIGLGVRFFVVGKGDGPLQDGLNSLRTRFPGSISLHLAFDESIAHNVYAASDIFLMPSRYEPCGLGQMIAMRYGTIPVVHRTGGLADTIDDAGHALEHLFCSAYLGETAATGFLFAAYDKAAFLKETRRALCVLRNRNAWQRLVNNAMTRDFSWTSSARQYLHLYEEALR